MKVLLVFPEFYSIAQTFQQGFESNGCEVRLHDYRTHVLPLFNKLEAKKLKLSYNWRLKWENYHLNIINKKNLELFYDFKPDLVLVYNNEMLLPETIIKFKEKSKVFFFLGDNPYYSNITNKYNLALLFLADQVFAPDTYWIKQLKLIGLSNIHFFISSSADGYNYKKENRKEEMMQYTSDIVFIGGNYSNSSGYKRSLFLSKFSSFDLKIYGDKGWNLWLEIFPELKPKLVLHAGRLNFELVNTIMNCSKIYPVDANPGILNGIHVRVFDCIQSGILPLVEYREDVDFVFKDLDIPIIYNYLDSKAIAQKYLNDESLRLKIISSLRDYILHNYSPKKAIEGILEYSW
jgi:hypothetical protein